MCAPKAPKAPEVQKIPVHQMMVLPDGGDPMVRQNLRGQRKLARSAMMFATAAGGGPLGAPPTTALGA